MRRPWFEDTRAPFPFAVCVCTARGIRSGTHERSLAVRSGFGPVGPACRQIAGFGACSRLFTPPSFPVACRRQDVPFERGFCLWLAADLFPVKETHVLGCHASVTHPGHGLRHRCSWSRSSLTDIACFVPPPLPCPLRHGSHRFAPGPADVAGAMCFTDGPR